MVLGFDRRGGRRVKELLELTRPFPPKYVHDDGRGNDHVPHHIVTQRLIQIFGRPPKIELLRELYDGDKLTGVVMRLTVPGFDPIEEAGDSDNPQSKTNGARAKDACSDAIKRCAMRLGLGLHLWAQKDYFLYDVLKRDEEGVAGEPERARPSASSPKSASEGGESAQLNTESKPSTDQGSMKGVEGEASYTALTHAPKAAPGSPPPVEPEELLALGSWDEVKKACRVVLLQLIASGQRKDDRIPARMDQLANLTPEELGLVAAHLKAKVSA